MSQLSDTLPSRLKPVLHSSSHPISLTARTAFVGPASAGNQPVGLPGLIVGASLIAKAVCLR